MSEDIIINKEMEHIIIGNTKYYGIAPELFNYITNLQQEKEALIDVAAEHLQNEILYKSRCKKAIEILKEAGCYDEETKTFCSDVWEELPKLLNILNGGDKSEK